jgi:hypothetical protein
VVALVRQPRKPPKGFREAQQSFTPALDVAVLYAAYGFSCAFTGADLHAEARADPRGALLVLGDDPLTTDPTLLIPACLDAIYAFERLHLAIGLNYSLLVNLEIVVRDFLETLNPNGRLRLPTNPYFMPSLVALDRLRRNFTA